MFPFVTTTFQYFYWFICIIPWNIINIGRKLSNLVQFVTIKRVWKRFCCSIFQPGQLARAPAGCVSCSFINLTAISRTKQKNWHLKNIKRTSKPLENFWLITWALVYKVVKSLVRPCRSATCSSISSALISLVPLNNKLWVFAEETLKPFLHLPIPFHYFFAFIYFCFLFSIIVYRLC